MRTHNRSIVSILIMLTSLISLMMSPQAFSQKKSAVMKIGTYDSRIVTYAWSRSDFFKQHMAKWNQKNDSAQKAHDSARVKELGVQVMSYQHLLHLMVFSNGSVSIVMANIKDKLPELAKSAGVSMIVSKWELNFTDPTIEVIDLTTQVAALFQPKENIDKMTAEIASQAPIPIDEMEIETEMLDYYCKLFGKK